MSDFKKPITIKKETQWKFTVYNIFIEYFYNSEGFLLNEIQEVGLPEKNLDWIATFPL